MILKTTLGNLEELIYKYTELLGWDDGKMIPAIIDGECSDDTFLGVSNYRIQIPSLDISLRHGDLMMQVEYGCGWEVESSCTVICELEEKNTEKYLGWTTNDYLGAVHDYFYPKFEEYEDLEDIPCYIDTSDFMEDEDEAHRYAAECEEAYDGELEDGEYIC